MRIIEVNDIPLDRSEQQPPIMVDSALGIFERRKVIAQEKRRREEIRTQIKEFNRGLKRKRIREKRIEQKRIIKKSILSGTIAAIFGTFIRIII